MKLNKSKNGGFTLIELLAVIVILSIVASLAIILTSELSNKSKENVYLATANSLVNAAGVYVNEGDGSSEWHDCEEGDCQYQCVLVENLMDNGYFSADILQSELAKGRKVVPTNVVYLERNKDTKSITKKYVVADDKTCGGVNRTKSNNPTVIIGKTLYYDGNKQSLVSVGSSPMGTIYYSEDSALDSSNYTTSGTTRIPQRKEIGEYTVYYYIEGNDNYNDKSGKVTSVILKDRPVVSLEPIKLTYTGKPQILVNVRNDKNRSTIYYSLKDKLSSSNYQKGSFIVPSGTDAGEYIVYYYAISTTTLSTELGNVSVLIEKAENPIEVTANKLTYDGKEKELVTTKDAQGKVYYSKKNELNYDNYKSYGLEDIPAGVNAGKYTVYYYVEGNENYKDKSGSIEVTIEKAENPIVVTANTLTYNGRQQILATTTKAEGTVYYSKSKKLTSSNYTGNAKVIPTGTNAGRYMVYYYVTGNDNYKDKSGSIEVTIKKVNNTIIVTGLNLAYTGKPQTLVRTTNAKGTVYYSTTKLTISNYRNGFTTAPTGTAIGRYTVYYYVTGDINHYAADGYVYATIKEPTCSSGYTMISGKCCPADYDRLEGNYCVRKYYDFDGSSCKIWSMYVDEFNDYLSFDELRQEVSKDSDCDYWGTNFKFQDIEEDAVYEHLCDDYSASHFASSGICYEVEYACKSTVISDCTVLAKNPS